MSRILSQDEINATKSLREYKIQECLPKFNKRYPNVVSCTITYTRTSDYPGGYIRDASPVIRHVNICTSSSRVTVECNNIDCTDGYIDISDVIQDMVNQHEESRNGTKYCDGWQDAERMGGMLCRCKLSYEIQIKYKS